MSKVQMLRALVKQRLTAAAEDIFGLFERTIAEYEETLCRSKEENERQRRLLDAVFNPQLRLHRAVFPADDQQLLVNKEDVPPEQQEWSSGLDQEEVKVQTQPSHIKEEQEEVWAGRDGEQLQGLEEADITKFTFTPVPVKSEDDDEENPQASQLHQRQTDQMETEADGEDCGGPEPDRNSDPDAHLTPDTEDCLEPEAVVVVGGDDDWKETREPQSGLNFLKNNACNSFEKPFRCFECGKGFNKNSKLKIHMRSHTGEKPFSCSLCFKRFSQKTGLDHHLQTHTGERPFTCSVCGKAFGQKAYLQKHLKCHTGEKPFNCSHCKKCFSRYEHLQSHMRTHTGEKPYSCNVCNRRFTWRCQLKNHKCGGESSQFHEVWTNQEGEQLQGLEEADITKFTFTPVPVKSEDGEEKPDFSQFHQRQSEQMKTEPYGEDSGGAARNCDPNRHLQSNTDDKTGNRFEPKTIIVNDTNTRETHLGSNFMKNNRYNSREKPYRCFVCGKQFNKTSHLKIHMRIHTGEKPFSCSLCGKRFTQKIGLDYHLKTHSREKPFSCPFCGKSFGQKAYLQKHLKCHTGEKPYSCSLCDRCFSRHEHLQSHMRTHTGEKPFSCNICDKRFTWRCQLKNHKCDGESSHLHEVWTDPGQENQGFPHIKEEQEEVWTSQEGEQLQRQEEADINKFTFTPVPVKSEDGDEEKPQSSQLHQRQTDQIKTEADGEDGGGPEPDRNSHPDSSEPPGLTSSSFIGQFWSCQPDGHP